MQPSLSEAHRAPRSLWWLEPAWLFALVVGGTMGAAAMQSKVAFELYGAPKYITEKHVLLTLVAILVFVLGRSLGQATGRVPRPAPKEIDGVIDRGFWLLTGLALFGYAVWFAVGLKNGVSPGTLREFLNTDDPLLAEQMRDEMFYTLPGITTCAQFGVAAVPLGLWLTFRGRPRIWPVTLLVLLAAGRALVFSERLALVELVVPGIVIF